MKTQLLLLIVFFQLISHAQSGIEWGEPMNVSPAGTGNLHPRIQLDSEGNPMVIWGRSNNQVMFARMDEGNFGSAVPINPDNLPAFTASWAGPHMASKGDTVYAVFKHTPEDVGHIYLLRSFDGGNEWSEPFIVDDINLYQSRFPVVSIDDDGQPVIAFMLFDTDFTNPRWVVTRSLDFGETYADEIIASGWDGSLVCDCCPAELITAGNKAALMFRNESENIRDTWAAISTDNAMTFPAGVNLDQNNWMLMSCPSSGPDGFITADTLYSVFMNGVTGTNRVYLSKMSTATLTSNGGSLLTEDFSGLNSQNFIRAANYGNVAVIAWKQGVSASSQLALLFTADITSGISNDFETVVSQNVTNLDIAITADKVHLVWQDDATGTVKYLAGSYQITGVEESAHFGISVYPNPCADYFSVLLPNPASGITLVNLLGETVFTQATFTSYLRIDTSGLPAGLYFLHDGSGRGQPLVVVH